MLLVLIGHAVAGGLYLSELGTPGSTGTAGVANPTNTFTADAAWTDPQLVEVGFRYKISNEWMLFANLVWEVWSVFSDNQLHS
jgi:long-subunit fatty acid transport protein